MKSSTLAPQTNSDSIPRLGRYVDLVLLGQGGMGAVYRGRDPDLDRPVAIKVVLDNTADFVERFRREAKAVARLQHPNIVQVFDFGQDQSGHPYFVMELVVGRALDQLLVERGRFSAVEVASVLSQAAAGLQAAHDAGIIHRDVKPSNLILDERGRIKLVDFGIARLDGSAMLTNPASMLGTPTYMSPEQVAGRPVDGRTDIYSLGISCFHLLAGSAPFESREPIALAIMHLNDELPSLIARAPATPPGLAALIVRMCSKQPDTRPPSAKAVVERVEQIQAELGGASRPLAAVAAAVAAGPPVRVPPTRAAGVAASVEQSTEARSPSTRRSPMMAIAAACAVLAAGITVAAVLLLKHPPAVGKLDAPPLTPVGPAQPGDSVVPPVKPPATGNGNAIVENAAHPVATGPVRFAVLKFKNVGADPELEFLTEGIGETVLTDLSGSSDKVAFVERNQLGSETGEIDFGQTKYVDPATRAALGKISGAEVAVQGGFQRAGKTVRITARFVHVETGQILDTVEITKPIGKADQLFGIQDAVSKDLKARLLDVARKVRSP